MASPLNSSFQKGLGESSAELLDGFSAAVENDDILVEPLDSAELLDRSSTMVEDDKEVIAEEEDTSISPGAKELDDDSSAELLDAAVLESLDDRDNEELLATSDEDESGMGGSQILSPEHAAKAMMLAVTNPAAIVVRIFFNSQTINQTFLCF